MDDKLEQQLEKQQLKALFWRRAAFIYKNGTKEEIERFDTELNNNPSSEVADIKIFKTLNEIVGKHFFPLYDKQKENTEAVMIRGYGR